MKQVTVYSTPTCHFCHVVKDHLNEKGVEYKEVDITKSPEVQQELVAKTGQLAVPITVIGDQAVVGAQMDKIDELIAA